MFKYFKKNELNCLFFSIQDMNYTFDFLNEIKDIKCSEAFRIIPKSNSRNKM